MSSSHTGRPGSWAAVTAILVGFTLAGIALTLGPNWILVAAGVAVAAVGGVLALVFDIMSDVIVEQPRTPAPQADRATPTP
ncbi:HGxxPAAW family protein [Bailinhaonella thermotolerans]|uniref:Uncharacterized protein n=1 Tax=Bailinhaonella thermotolerans TaxID=1070861 RepID=A0A3A4BP67_9ACTN|nr:HGxxPAAW family protein [Bailinhaonella thermotolerans]RJL32814.1 hypothetical protein D5H75_15275 [Bailinhaonella thermotolerans]